jgi:hypothetical protein
MAAGVLRFECICREALKQVEPVSPFDLQSIKRLLSANQGGRERSMVCLMERGMIHPFVIFT